MSGSALGERPWLRLATRLNWLANLQPKNYRNEKPQGIRVATDFFNNEADIERLIEALDEEND